MKNPTRCAIGVALLIIMATQAHSDTIFCSAQSSPGFITGRIDANVIADTNPCVLSDAKLDGNFVAEEDNVLFCTDSTIEGNIESEEDGSIVVLECTVVGNVKSEGGGSVLIRDSRIDDGNVENEYEGDTTVEDSRVYGNVKCAGGDSTNFISGYVEGNIENCM